LLFLALNIGLTFNECIVSLTFSFDFFETAGVLVLIWKKMFAKRIGRFVSKKFQ
jgi:hypothetical protein